MLRRRHLAIGLPTRVALAAVAALVAAAGGCSDPAAIRPGDIRSYRAAKPVEPPSVPAAGSVAPTITYTPPDGWTDRGRSGMRLATLVFDDPLGAQEVTIIRAAGSPEANVARWWGQIDPAASPAENAARTSATLDAAQRIPVGDSEGLIVLLAADPPADGEPDTPPDADAQQADAASADVILGGMIPIDDSAAVFVKFKGPAAAARRARERFIRLVSSIRWHDAAE